MLRSFADDLASERERCIRSRLSYEDLDDQRESLQKELDRLSLFDYDASNSLRARSLIRAQRQIYDQMVESGYIF